MLNKIFDMDNPVMRFMAKTFDMMILNFLFILCSIPIFTIGASLSALHYCCLKMKEPDEGYMYKNFFHSFKVNFKQGLGLGIPMLFLGLVLYLEYRATSALDASSVRMVRIMILVAAVIWYMVLCWLFALQSRFVNTVGQTYKNAMLLTFAKAPRSAAMVLIVAAELIIIVRSPAVVQSYSLLWLIMFGFSVQVLINTQLQYPVIKELMPGEAQENEPVVDSQFTVDETADVSELGYTPLPKEEEESSPKEQESSPEQQAAEDEKNIADH